MTSHDDDHYENTQHLSLFIFLAVLTIGNSRALGLNTLPTSIAFDSRADRDTSRKSGSFERLNRDTRDLRLCDEIQMDLGALQA